MRRHRRPRPGEGAGRRRRDRRHRRRGRRRRPTSPTRPPCRRRSTRRVLAFGGLDLVVNNAGLSLSKPLLETTEADWDLQHDVMAKGSFLVVAGRRAGADRAGAGRRHRLHLRRRTRCSPARTTSPTRRPRPTRPTRCGCSPPSSASTASGSTASTPTASSQGSGIFAGGWGANRAAVYGVEEKDLGEFYAQRTHPQARGAARARRQRGVRARPART